jgi:hypothetical protein
MSTSYALTYSGIWVLDPGLADGSGQSVGQTSGLPVIRASGPELRKTGTRSRRLRELAGRRPAPRLSSYRTRGHPVQPGLTLQRFNASTLQRSII